jgi:PAS domain S-box-containing protein
MEEVRTLWMEQIYATPHTRTKLLERLKAQRSLTGIELKLRRRDGDPVWIMANVSYVEPGDGAEPFLEGTFVDITDRKRAEETLAEEARIVALRADVGAALIRPGTLREGLQRCTDALVARTGAAFARVWTLDYLASNLVLEASSGLYTHLNGPHGSVPLGEFKIGRIAQRREAHLSNDVQNDPEVGDREWAKREGLDSFLGYPLIAGERVVGVIAAFGRQILTETVTLAFSSLAGQIAQYIQAKRAEEALLKSEERAMLLFATIPHAAYVYDLETLDFLEVNDAAIERYGYTREEFLNMKITQIWPPEDVPAVKADLKRRTRSPRAFAGQWKHRTRDGRILDVEINFQLLDYDGRRAVLTIAQDVTERNKLEIGLRHAQKLEAVGGLASGIAHEINTPIQFVGDNLRFLQDGFNTLGSIIRKFQELRGAAETGSAGGELLQEVNRAVEDGDLPYLTEEIPKALSQSLDGVDRVATIVRAMKEFAHPEQGRRAAADLNRALASTLIVARNEIKYVADVVTDFGDLPTVECCLGDLNQVFLNILVNAAHAIKDAQNGSGKKGTIRIETRHEGAHVRISFSDTGSGIPEAIRDKVFEPFFTTKAVGSGTGQGLAISRSIVVEKHGGTLTFDTEVGRGTTFRITLPVSNSAGGQPAAER